VVANVFDDRQRPAAMIAFAAVAFQAAAGLAFALVHELDLTRTTDIARLSQGGPATADLFRWALWIDMIGYLAVAPVVLFLQTRMQLINEAEMRAWQVRVATWAGLTFSIVGAIGAAFLAAASRPLFDATLAGGPAAAAAQTTFAALANGVYAGLWGVLEWLAAALWVGLVGWLVRREGRAFAAASMLAAVGAVAYAATAGLTGRAPGEILGLIDVVALAALGLFFVWEIWLAIRLWRGARPASPTESLAAAG
jgi:hypothetical protein